MRKQLYASLIGLISFIGVNQAQAQIQTLSPYSAYGLGDVNSISSQHFTDMGGTSIGMFSSSFVNPSNPASYTSLSLTNFEIGGSGTFTKYEQGNNENGYNNVNFSHLMLGADLGEKAGLAFGILPYSSVGYDLDLGTTPVDNVQNIDSVSVKRLFQGEGGINKIFLGGSYKVNNELSFGLQGYYYFGNIINKHTSEIDDASILSIRNEDKISISDVGFEFGVQYSVLLSEERRLTLGATFAPENKLSSKQTINKYSYVKTTIGESIVDTLVDSNPRTGTVTTPASFGFGVSYEKPDNWMIGADIKLTQWEGTSIFGQTSSALQNEVALSLGGSFIPNSEDVRYFWKRVEYRGGLKFKTGRLEILSPENNTLTNINEIGINFGMGIPLRKAKGTINLGVELGQRGTADNALIKETYFKTYISFTFRDKWFVKRKID